MILKSRFVVPVAGPVIESGAVTIDGGRIVGVDSARALGTQAHQDVVDYGDAVICPGFVNAHTHLELSLLAGEVPPSADFSDWLRRLSVRLTASPPKRERTQEAVRLGVEQSLAAGVTCVGDITRASPWSRPTLVASPLCGVSFGEVISIGSRRSRLADRLDTAALPTGSETIRSGISPHAPYTVEPDALAACARRARDASLPLCIHLAETQDEEQFTQSASGPFAELLRDLGSWDDRIPKSGCGPVELAHRTGVLGTRTLIAHGNYVGDGDIELIARAGASVAYCPRTHHAFGHQPHRFRDMLAAGINVCVGTDSLASNPSLSILDELRFLRAAHPDVAASELLAMGTLRGAQALGLADLTGSISVGRRADLVVIPLDDSQPGRLWESVLESTRAPLTVYAAGVEQTIPGSA